MQTSAYIHIIYCFINKWTIRLKLPLLRSCILHNYTIFIKVRIGTIRNCVSAINIKCRYPRVCFHLEILIKQCLYRQLVLNKYPFIIRHFLQSRLNIILILQHLLFTVNLSHTIHPCPIYKSFTC